MVKNMNAYENGRVIVIRIKDESAEFVARWEFRGAPHRGEALVYKDGGEWFALGQVIEEGTNFAETPRLVACTSMRAAVQIALHMVAWADISVHGVALDL